LIFEVVREWPDGSVTAYLASKFDDVSVTTDGSGEAAPAYRPAEWPTSDRRPWRLRAAFDPGAPSRAPRRCWSSRGRDLRDCRAIASFISC